MIKLPPGVVIQEQPIEVSARHTIQSLLTRILGLYEEMYNRFGEEGLSLIRDVSTDYGEAIGKRARGKSDPWDSRDIGLFLTRVFNNVYADGEIIDFEPDRVSISVDKCIYPFRDVKICQAHTTMERALVQQLNPKMDYVVEKSIPGGDPKCLHVITTLD